MQVLSIDLILIGALAFLLAGAVKGLAGLGMPTTAASILTLTMAPRTAIALVIFPMIASNAWQTLRQGDTLKTFVTYRAYGASLAVFVLITVYASATASDRVIFTVLGLSIALFSLVNLAFTIPALPDRFDTLAQSTFGIIAGILGGMSGIWAAPLAIYLMARGVDKEEFVRATGLLIFIGSLPLALGYLFQGFLTADLALMGGILILPTLLGFALGEHLRRRLSSEKFRRVFLWLFLLLGLNLLRRGLL